MGFLCCYKHLKQLLSSYITQNISSFLCCYKHLKPMFHLLPARRFIRVFYVAISIWNAGWDSQGTVAGRVFYVAISIWNNILDKYQLKHTLVFYVAISIWNSSMVFLTYCFEAVFYVAISIWNPADALLVSDLLKGFLCCYKHLKQF